MRPVLGGVRFDPGRVADRYESPLHDTGVAARLGVALGVTFGLCFATGLWSHLAQDPPSWFTYPARPAGLYRVTQGVHVASGMASIPLLLAKLWTVYPRFTTWPPVRSALHAVERIALLPLVGGSLFLLLSGVANVARWYPWTFFFPRAHFWTAWLTIGALAVHIGAKATATWTALRPRPTAATATGSPTTAAEPTMAEPATTGLAMPEHTATGHTTAEPATAGPTTAEPTTARPATAEPTTARPATAGPTNAEPTTAEPATAEPTTAEPTTAEPATAGPTTARPATAEPTTNRPATAEPATAGPTMAGPTMAEPGTAEPATDGAELELGLRRDRRAFLGGVAAASGVLVVATVGGTFTPLGGVSVLAQRVPGTGPQGLPVNKSAAGAGVIDLARRPDYRLVVEGAVDRRLELSLDDLRALPQHEATLPIACVEGWSASARWRGVRVRDLLALASAKTRSGAAVTVDVESLQPTGRYRRSVLNADQSDDPDTLLALELDGETLHIDHGYPVRLIGPNRPGVLQTKWVARLVVA